MSKDEKTKNFNQKFDEQQTKRKFLMRKKMQEKLDSLNNNTKTIPLHKLSVGAILINTKDSIFEILDDLLQFKLSAETFTKDNRLYYIGIFIIMIVILVLVYNLFFEEENLQKPKSSTDTIGPK